MTSNMEKGAYPSINQKDVAELKIPLPPLSIQKEIVEKIESFQGIIDGAKQVVENYKPQIDISPDWKMIELSKATILITKGSSPNWQGIEYTNQEEGILFVTSENVKNGYISLEKKKYVESRFNKIEKKSILKYGDILTNIVGASIGRTAIYNLKEIANMRWFNKDIHQTLCKMRA